MSREGLRIAARDRARRAGAAVGEGAVVLMGVPLVVLHELPRGAIAAGPADAANGAEVAPPVARTAPAARPLR